MSYLIDTSAIINIVQQKGGDAIALLRDQYTLDIAFYESGNAIRTLYHRNDLDRTEALELASDIAGVWMTMRVVSYSPLDMNAMLDMAMDLDIAFYDAAFLFQAKQLNIPIVTDDKPFQKKIPGTIKWIDSTELNEIKTHDVDDALQPKQY